jgi:hypothetical protein
MGIDLRESQEKLGSRNHDTDQSGDSSYRGRFRWIGLCAIAQLELTGQAPVDFGAFADPGHGD